ncbi:putative P-loop containing nucleoside triphosphate hydrolase, leucine-rich repeat domain superfamily [Helianthus debilis subsp. tardiflorus]
MQLPLGALMSYSSSSSKGRSAIILFCLFFITLSPKMLGSKKEVSPYKSNLLQGGHLTRYASGIMLLLRLQICRASLFLGYWHETNTLKKIVETIYQKLDRKEVHLPLNIIGMETRYKEINSWLDKTNYAFLAIYGMGGSGKTTLAKYIYGSNQKSFENVSFIENIGSRSEKPNGLLKLQEHLLKDILRGKKRKIPGVSRGTCMIKEALQMRRALIVLDDIVEHSQLVTLLGTGKINEESKIIITTRENTDNWFDSSCWKCQQYEMKLFNEEESSDLLCRHAFGSKKPMEGFKELVQHAVKYCEGNPLALEVLGSSMPKNTTIKYWRSQLNLLEKDIHAKIQSVLERSYMSLPYNSEKELFLHIACFFIDKDVDYVVKILEPDYSALCGIQTLIKRCLLSISPNKKLTMHKLLQEMGKNIVRQESKKFPAKRSRVWLSSDSYMILSKGKGSKKIEGLTLDMKMLSKEDTALKPSPLKIGALTKMVNLKLLQLNFTEFYGRYDFDIRFEDLRWLCWHGYRFKYIPSNSSMGKLVAIDMSYSNLKAFDPPTVIQSLKILNLKDSRRLTKIRDLFNMPNLETLILWNCSSLAKIYKTIVDHSSLALLNLTGCKALRFIKLVPMAKLNETDLGHMEWLQQYIYYEMCLVGDELTIGRSWHIQMLYEFNIMSTSLPDIREPNLRPKYISKSSSLSFDVPSCPENKRLKGINVTFKYAISGEDWAWFCKINSTNGVVDLMYNPKVFGKPESGKACIWLSYWPIGNTLDTGDTVNVSIIVMSGLEVHECGVSLVYSDQETLGNNMGLAETMVGDLSGFQLSTGAYYLCRRDFFELMEVGRLTPDWFRILVGDTVDYTEVRGWRKTGRPKQVNPSFTELKTIRCIMDGPELEDIYEIAEMSKSSDGVRPRTSNSTFDEITMEESPRTASLQHKSDILTRYEAHERQSKQKKSKKKKSVYSVM